MPDRPCPNCGTMRPEAATFCANCGQDLRPGARSGTSAPAPRSCASCRPGAPPACARPARGRHPPCSAPRRRLPRGRRPSRPPLLEDRGCRAWVGAGPLRRPRPPRPPRRTRSFTDRYRGTNFETPEAKAMAPARPAMRVIRLGGVLVVILAVVAVAGYGALQVLSHLRPWSPPRPARGSPRHRPRPGRWRRPRRR